MFYFPVIAGNCGLSPESGKEVSRKRGEQDVLIELGKLGCYREKRGVIGKKGVVIGKKG